MRLLSVQPDRTLATVINSPDSPAPDGGGPAISPEFTETVDHPPTLHLLPATGTEFPLALPHNGPAVDPRRNIGGVTLREGSPRPASMSMTLALRGQRLRSSWHLIWHRVSRRKASAVCDRSTIRWRCRYTGRSSRNGSGSERDAVGHARSFSHCKNTHVVDTMRSSSTARTAR